MKFSRSAGAAALCAAAVVLSMPAAAHAGGTKDPRYAAPPASSAPTSACSDRAPYTGQWVGHGRSIDLRDNGSGTITLGSGASNSETWTLGWKAQKTTVFPDCGILTEVKAQTKKIGEGSYGLLSAGKQFEGALGKREGHTVLLMSLHPGQDSIAFCRKDDYARDCGA